MPAYGAWRPAGSRMAGGFRLAAYHSRPSATLQGLTTSTGLQLICHVPMRLDSKEWVKILRRRVGPFMRSAFPERSKCTILFDGETLLHTDDAKAAMRQAGLRALPAWPSHSPDLNPQENVWAWAEPHLRKAEAKADTFAKFKQRVCSVRFVGRKSSQPGNGRSSIWFFLEGGERGGGQAARPAR